MQKLCNTLRIFNDWIQKGIGKLNSFSVYEEKNTALMLCCAPYFMKMFKPEPNIKNIMRIYIPILSYTEMDELAASHAGYYTPL